MAERERPAEPAKPALRETSELIEKLVHMKRKRGGGSQPGHERTLLQLALQRLSASAEAAHALPRHFRSRSKLSSAESAASALGLLPALTELPDGGGAPGAASSRSADTNGVDRGHDSSSIALRRSARRSHDPPANPPPQQQTQKRRRPNADLMKPPPPTFFVRRQQESNVDLRSKMRHPPKDFSLSTDDKLFFRRAKVKDLDDPSRWLHLDINSSTSSSAGFIMNDEPVSRPEVSYSVIHSIYQTVDGTRWAEHTDFYDLDDFRKQAESLKKNTSQFLPSNTDNQSKEPISSKELFKVRGRRHTPLANIETDDFRIVRKSEYDQLDESDKGEDAFFWRYEFDPRTMERTGTEEDEPRRERQ
jgi:hypothetical protein